jgi:hypothetical protein
LWVTAGMTILAVSGSKYQAVLTRMEHLDKGTPSRCPCQSPAPLSGIRREDGS